MSSLRDRVLGLLKSEAPVREAVEKITGNDPVSRYHAGGRLPWTEGYSKVRTQIIRDALADASMMERFRTGAPLPAGYGPRMDERVVECPWTLSRLRPGKGRVLDAGSVLNRPLFLEQPQLRERPLFIYSLEINWVTLRENLSYLRGDFLDPVLRDGLFESIVCISTLEHVGMLPIPKLPYVPPPGPPPPTDRAAHRAALAEFHRLLVPGGQLMVTVPFGRAADLQWQQVFDHEGIRAMIAAFPGRCLTEAYYRYSVDGWQVSSAEEAAGAEYYDAIVRMPDYDPDFAAAARGVACLEFVRER